MIGSIVSLLQPFLPQNDGNPGQLGVNKKELDNTLKVLNRLTRLYRTQLNQPSECSKVATPPKKS